MLTPWPGRADLEHVCAFLARPAPPRLTHSTLAAVASLGALARHLALQPDRSLVSRLQSHVVGWRRRCGGGILTFYDAAYPELLRHIAHPPLVLFVQGDVRCLGHTVVTIVGARAASAGAIAWTHETAADLVRCGVVVASGLARGVDAAAHAGALGAGGATIAVLGGGLDRIYPPEHEGLARRIVAQGCLVSEFPPGTLPRPWHFPMRNRILAGLGRGVVVVQAEPKSGALVTARHARDESRDVMAVPGDVTDPRSRGPHDLLRDGAALVATAADVLEVIGWQPRSTASAQATTSGEVDAMTLLAALGDRLAVDTLVQRLDWSAARVQRVLAELELAGVVERDVGGVVRRQRC